MSYIQFPITVNSVEVKEPYSLYKMGGLAKVRPCGDEYAGKTYLGIFLGELTDGAYATYNNESGVLTVGCSGNPAIFVPELNKIVWGYESWWSRIESADAMKEITNADIQNTWYVKLFYEIASKETDHAEK